MARKNNKDRGVVEIPKGSGVYWVDTYGPELPRGKRIRRKFGEGKEAKKKAEAFYKAHREKVQLARDRPDLADQLFPKPKVTETPVTLAEVITTYRPDFERKASRKNLLAYADKWTEVAGDIPIREISREHAKLRQAALLDRGLKPASVNRDLAFIKMVTARAFDEGLIDRNPLARFKNLPENNIRHRWLNWAEEDRIAAVMAPEDFEIVAFALDVGLREKELFTLSFAQVNFAEPGWVTITKAKGNKSRVVSLTPRALAILQRRYENRTSPFVFPNKVGKPMDPQNFINRKFYPALRAAGLEPGEETPDGVTFHTLRHSCGSRMALANVSLQKIGKVLGHARSSTSERYAHLQQDSVREATAALVRDPAQKSHLKAVK